MFGRTKEERKETMAKLQTEMEDHFRKVDEELMN